MKHDNTVSRTCCYIIHIQCAIVTDNKLTIYLDKSQERSLVMCLTNRI